MTPTHVAMVLIPLRIPDGLDGADVAGALAAAIRKTVGEPLAGEISVELEVVPDA